MNHGCQEQQIGVTSDDGFESEGFLTLVAALNDRGWRLRAASTLRPWHSFGTATGLIDMDAVTAGQKVIYNGGVAIHGYGCMPASVVQILLSREFKDVSCLVAGVNRGPNVGQTLLHSGTFSAVLTSSWLGVKGIAVSLDDVYSVDEASPGVLQFARAAYFAATALEWLMDSTNLLMCNINVPNSSTNFRPLLVPALPAGFSGAGDRICSDVEALGAKNASITVFPHRSIEPSVELSCLAATEITARMSRLVDD